jgi:anti-anti-sigma regulatory factor
MKEINFKFPESIDDGRLDSILSLFSSIRSSQSVKYALNFERTQNISAAGIAILMCLSDSLREHQTPAWPHSFQLKNTPTSDFLRSTLSNSGLQNLVPIRDMRFFDKNYLVQGVEDSIAPQFLDEVERNFKDQVSEDDLWYARLILNELMQNAKDHSTSERFYIYFGKESDHLQFGVCDMGVSIPAKIEQKYVASDDMEYLKKSLELHVGTRRTRKGGLGLNHMFKILQKQKGRLVIISRDAQMRIYFQRGQTKADRLKEKLYGTWCMARLHI